MKKIEKKVAKLYTDFPFPSIPITKKEQLHNNIVYNTVYYLTLPYLDQYNKQEIKILEAGCGTGELALGLGLNAPNRKILALDRNRNSLEEARRRAKKYKINNVTFKQFDLAYDELPSNYYDVVYSIGVIHHIPNTEKIFKKLVEATKVGGYITIGLYSPYGMFRKSVERKILHILAGEDLHKRVELARRLFYRRKVTRYEEISLADTYAHPLQQHFTIEEVMRWQKKYNLHYIASEPPIEISKSIALFIEVIKDLSLRRKVNLVSAWHRTLKSNHKSFSWETSPPFTSIVQFVWVVTGIFFGRGEFYNIIAQKIK